MNMQSSPKVYTSECMPRFASVVNCVAAIYTEQFISCLRFCAAANIA